MKRVLALLLSVCLLLSAAGCAYRVRAMDLMEDISANPVTAEEDLSHNAPAVADFALQLFQNTLSEGENTLISPLSILCALAMTANGAKGETLEQMEQVFGLSLDELNRYLHSYLESLPQGDKYQLRIANSIWIKDTAGLAVERDFLQANADYYGAAAYRASFDETTLRDMNGWVKDHTDGMIKDIVSSIPENAVMYLVNALAFEAQWEMIYEKEKIKSGTFTAASQDEQSCKLMYSTERAYLEDANATGFIKYYSGQKYAFVALLPNEGVSVGEYVVGLTGDHLMELLSQPQSAGVQAAIPKFEVECSVELSEILHTMGMSHAFDTALADFSGLGTADENIWIDIVQHKAVITVDAKGTKAGAATSVGIKNGAAEETKTVILNRPFVYLLMDCQTNLPFFMGTVNKI